MNYDDLYLRVEQRVTCPDLITSVLHRELRYVDGFLDKGEFGRIECLKLISSLSAIGDWRISEGIVDLRHGRGAERLLEGYRWCGLYVETGSRLSPVTRFCDHAALCAATGALLGATDSYQANFSRLMNEGSLAPAYVEELAWFVTWLLQSNDHPESSIDKIARRLGRYAEVVEHWDSDDLKQVIGELCEWRADMSQTSSGVYYNEPFCAFPAEVLLIARTREMQGLSPAMPSHSLLPDFLQNIPAPSEPEDVRLAQLMEILPKVN